MSSEPWLSLVIPMYNEAHRLRTGVGTMLAWLSERYPDCQVILVDDGSGDGTSAEAATLLRENPKVAGELVTLPHNRGKGGAVKAGMAKAAGQIRGFADADNATPIEELDRLLPLVETEEAIVIGSRGLRDSNIEERQPWWREIMGRSFNLLVRLVLGFSYRDTQCGFKLFGKKAAEVCFSQQRLDHYAFDLELLYLAHLHGFSVKEVPVRWLHQEESRVHPIRDSMKMALDLFRLAIRGKNKGKN